MINNPTATQRAPARKSSLLKKAFTKKASIRKTLFAGALATVAFDFWGPSLAPMLGFAKLDTVKLPTKMIEVVFGAVPTGSPELVHYATGLILYPLGWLLVTRSLWQAILPSLHWSMTALAYGVVLWLFAMYVVAHLITGLPAFLGFTDVTWIALSAHLIYALVLAWGLETSRLD